MIYFISCYPFIESVTFLQTHQCSCTSYCIISMLLSCKGLMEIGTKRNKKVQVQEITESVFIEIILSWLIILSVMHTQIYLLRKVITRGHLIVCNVVRFIGIWRCYNICASNLISTELPEIFLVSKYNEFYTYKVITIK